MEELTTEDFRAIQGVILAANSYLEVDTCRQRIMEEIEELIPHSCHVFWLFDLPGMKLREPVFRGVTEEALEEYLAHYQPLDYQFHLALEEAKNGKLIVRRGDFSPDREVERNEFYFDFLRHQSIYYALICQFCSSQGIFAGFGLFRPKEARPFSDREFKILNILHPHLTNTLRNALCFQDIRRDRDLFEAVLAYSQKGLFLFNERLNLVYLNTSGKELCRRIAELQGKPSKDLRIPGFVWKAASGIYEFFRQGVPEVSRTSQSIALGPEERLSIRSIALSKAEGGCYYLVILEDISEDKGFDFDKLSREHHLSEREVEVIQLIIRGCSSKEIASRLYISEFTVNDHLKHIYEKISIHSRTELIYRILEGFKLPSF